MLDASYRVLVIAAGLFFGGLPKSFDLAAGEFHEAVRLNDLKAVERLLKNSPKRVNSLAERGTPLHIAVQFADVDMVRFLIAHGANVKATFGANKFTPLHWAEDADIARVLLEDGADMNAKSPFGSPLQRAISSNNLELVDVFVKAGAKLVFEQQVELGKFDEVLKLLDSEPWLAKPPSKCLHAAADHGHLEVARLLLDHGADPNQDYPFSNVSGVYSPLSAAVRSRHYNLARLLCERGAGINVSGGKRCADLFEEVLLQNDPRFIELLLEHGADVESHSMRDSCSRPCAPLHFAAERGNLELCKLLLRHKANVNSRTSLDATPLDYGAKNQRASVCELLLDNGAELSLYAACGLGKRGEVERFLRATPDMVNEQDKLFRRPPLFWACAAGSQEIVKLLIDDGADINALAASDWVPEEQRLNGSEPTPAKGKVGETPLHVAARFGHSAVIELLLDHGAKIDAFDDDHYTPLFLAIAHHKRNAAMLLLENGATVEFEGAIPATLRVKDCIEFMDLILARHPSQSFIDRSLDVAATEDVNIAKLLLARGANANIYAACALGLDERVVELLAFDPSLVNKPKSSSFHEQPLSLAAENGHLTLVKTLLAKGAVIQPRTANPPLHAAAARGQLEVMSLLVASGADINHKNSDGATPLHAAASGNHFQAVEWLIERGANVQARDISRRTALHVAARDGAVEVARKLLDNGVPVDCRDNFGETPLHGAVNQGHLEMVKLLMHAGASVNAKNRHGNTPLYYAETEYCSHWLELGIERDRKSVAALLHTAGRANENAEGCPKPDKCSE